MTRQEYKKLFQELCKSLETSIRLSSSEPHLIKHKVTFVERDVQIEGQGYIITLEVIIDGVKIFSETGINEQGYDENIVLKTYYRLLQSTFCYGVMASKRELDKIMPHA